MIANSNNSPSLLFAPTLSFILGIFWQQNYNLPKIFLIILSILIIFFCTIIWKKPSFDFKKITCFLMFFTGALLLQNQKDNHHYNQQSILNKKLNLIATVASKTKHVENLEALRLNIKKLKYENNTEYVNTNFDLICYSKYPTQLQVSDEIEIKDLILKSNNNQNKILAKLDFNHYLLKENILSSFFSSKNQLIKISSPNQLIKISSPTISINRSISNKKNGIFKSIKNKMTEKTFCFFSSIFLGNKKNKLIDKMKNKFNHWGISHQTARSGIHIAIFILICIFILRLLPINFYTKKILLIMLCLIYYQLSWESLSFFRAFYLFLFYQLGQIFNLQVNFIYLLTLLCFLILIFNPIQALFLDFQLSFGITFFLSWASKYIYKQTSKY